MVAAFEDSGSLPMKVRIVKRGSRRPHASAGNGCRRLDAPKLETLAIFGRSMPTRLPACPPASISPDPRPGFQDRPSPNGQPEWAGGMA